MPISHAHLRSFHAVATHGSFTRAAETLHVTQPTLSGQVKELEERYGVKLFVRYGRRIELTELGHSALAITNKLFHHEEEVEQLLRSAKNLTTGDLQVGADSPYIVTPLLAQFQRLYPDIQISIKYGNSAQVMQWLESQQCDIAILPNVPSDDRFQILPLGPGQLVIFVAKTHPWAGRKSISIEELASQRVILREKGSRTRSIFENALKIAGIELADVMEISSREGIREAVAVGFGVGVVSENELGADGRVTPLSVNNADLTHSELVVCLKQTRSVQVTNAFLELVASHLDK
ncbi:MAG: LysR family transcriptional regulator [Gammaproteobacteria bacterium]|nr:LysR family transcriptional regulator [Gammaproteobacteria bacterium]